MNDLQIIELFWSRDEAAISQSDAKYGRLLHHISYNILSSREDSEECVNDTYISAWNTIPPKRPDGLLAYLGRIVRNLSINRWHENRAKKRDTGLTVLLSELSDCIPASGSPEEEMELHFLTEVITHWLETLPPEDRSLFLRRYWFGDSLSELAKTIHTTPNKLAGRMFRLRQTLRNVLEKEGISL